MRLADLLLLTVDQVPAAAPTDVLGQVLQWGLPGTIIILLLLGWLVPKGSYEQMRADRVDWQRAYEQEREAHQITRDALVDANRAAAASVETARTTTAILSTLGHAPNPRGTVN